MLADNPIAPVAPTQDATPTSKPLGLDQIKITGGFWHRRQTLNRDVSLPHGARMLEEWGALDNLRIAAGQITGSYRGMVFNDSDVYKWIEAAAWELAREPDEPLRARVDAMVALIEQAQAADGYLHSYHQIVAPDKRFTDLQHGHELYCAGHLMQAAVALHRASGTDRLLAVAVRLADYIDRVFTTTSGPGLCGHPEIEMALVELYRETGTERYLRLAQTLIDRRGYGRLGKDHIYHSLSYYQDQEPVRQAHTVAGHAVRALYLLSGIADVASETHEEALLDAMQRQWNDMVAMKMYLTGGVGSRHFTEAFGDPYELPPDRAYCETCAAIASVMWNWRLLLLTGHGKHADLIERTLFNAIAVSPSTDGARWFYSNPLQSNGHEERASWFHVACCPPNVMRLWSSLAHYLATASANGIQIHQYADSELRVPLSAGRIGLRLATDYPWDGQIEIEIVESFAGAWELALRIPSWCDRWTLSVNGSPTESERPADGYARLRRRWQPADTIALHLALEPRFTTPHPRIDAIRSCLAIERGPLVYCLEEADQAAGIDLRDVLVDPNQGIKAAPGHHEDGVEVLVEVMGNVRTGVESTPLYGNWQPHVPADEQLMRLRARPYYAWANRGPGRMRVWIPSAR